MDIKEIPYGTLASTLEALLKAGKVSEDDLRMAMTTEPSTEMKHTVDLIHTVMCIESHGRDASGSGRLCDYYVEDSLAECWTLATHKKWLKSTTDLMADYNLTTITDIRNALRIVTDIADTLRKQAGVNYQHFSFIARMLQGIMFNMLRKGSTKEAEPLQLSLNLKG